MRKNEKQTVIILGVLIVIIAVVMAVMLFSGRDTGSSSSDGSLRDAVQQESNSQEEEGSDVSEGEDAADQAPEEDLNDDEETAEEEDTSDTEETSTEETKNKTASEIMDADDGYVFPDVDTTYLSKSSVEKLSDSELQYAVNEVYARHGLKFTKKINKERFEKKSWYKGTVSDQDSISLNKYEKKNVDTMASELKKRGLR